MHGGQAREKRRLERSAIEAHTIATEAIRAASFTAHEPPQLSFEGIDDLLGDLSKFNLPSQSSSFCHLLPVFVEARLFTYMAADRFWSGYDHQKKIDHTAMGLYMYICLSSCLALPKAGHKGSNRSWKIISSRNIDWQIWRRFQNGLFRQTH